MQKTLALREHRVWRSGPTAMLAWAAHPLTAAAQYAPALSLRFRTSASCLRIGGRKEEVQDLDLQQVREAGDRIQGEILCPCLDASDVGRRDARFLSEGCLREPASSSDLGETPTQIPLHLLRTDPAHPGKVERERSLKNTLIGVIYFCDWRSNGWKAHRFAARKPSRVFRSEDGHSPRWHLEVGPRGDGGGCYQLVREADRS